jgi:hypothetical protein
MAPRPSKSLAANPPTARRRFLRAAGAPLILLAAALLPAANAAGPPPAPGAKSFLFLGNSFTFRHELPQLFAALANEGNPGQPVFAHRETYGGRDMFRHFELFRSQDLLCLGSLADDQIRQSIGEMRAMAALPDEPPFYSDYWKKIDASALIPFEQYEAESAAEAAGRPKAKSRKALSRWGDDRRGIQTAIKNHESWISERASYPAKWDYVVLQSWQDVNPDPETGYVKYATKFIELARRQQTTPILYITAPYCQNAGPVQEPIEPERVRAELRIASDLARKTGAIVVPVPLAVYRLQKAGAAPALRYQNDGHPNQTCAYLTACLFYAAVYDKSPEGLGLSEVVETKIVDRKRPDRDPDGGPLKKVFADQERALLQRAAWETIQAFRAGDFGE